MADLHGKTVVVTGGNAGIGFGLAAGVGQAGADVAIWARNEKRNAAAVAQLAEAGIRASWVRCDVTQEEDVETAMNTTLERHGQVDAMFANAGVMGGGTPFAELSLGEWRKVLAVNLDGAFVSLRAATRHMIERGSGGALIAVSSTASIHGAPRQEPYSASKAAVAALMRSLAVELARYRVRCNTLVPGWTDTELLTDAKLNQRFVENTVARTPVRRWGTPGDFGEAAAFLADPAISYHTGDTMVVDGGYTVF